MELLKPEDFYEPLNGKFFGIMSEMYTQNKPVDINTAIIELKEHNLYEPIGDSSFIVQIIQRITTTAHIYHHAEIVRNYAFCRRMITAGQNISRIAQKPGIEPSEIVSEAEAEILKASQNTESSSPVVLADIDELRSAEVSAEQLMQRMYAAESGVSLSSITEGRMTDDDFYSLTEASERLSKRRIFINDSSELSAVDFRTKCRRFKTRHSDLALIVVDYLQLMHTVRTATITASRRPPTYREC